MSRKEANHRYYLKHKAQVKTRSDARYQKLKRKSRVSSVGHIINLKRFESAIRVALMNGQANLVVHFDDGLEAISVE